MNEQNAYYEERILYYRDQITLLEQEQVNADKITLIRELLEDLQKCHQQNLALRKLVLKSSSQQNKMSTKLRDALYE